MDSDSDEEYIPKKLGYFYNGNTHSKLKAKACNSKKKLAKEDSDSEDSEDDYYIEPTPRKVWSKICKVEMTWEAFRAACPIVQGNFEVPETIPDKPQWKGDPAIPPSNIGMKILSIVASVRLGCPIDLKSLSMKSSNLEFNQDNFTCLKLFLKNPYAVGMTFASGNMVITGTNSISNCKLASTLLSAKIMACGFHVRPRLKIQNITLSVDLGFKIRLHALQQNRFLQQSISPSDSFSGVTLEMETPKARIVLFQSGRALITGVKEHAERNFPYVEFILHTIGVTSLEDGKAALDFLYPIGKMYCKC